MKNLKTLLVALALFVGASTFVTAQSKIAHINKQELIKAMPAYKTAQTEIEQLGKTYEAQFQDSLKELENKLKQYDAEAPQQTQEENQKRMQEVEGMKQSIGQYQQKMNQDLQKKEFDLLKPIVEEADAAIKAVAKAQGFQYVLDSGMLIMAEGKDLMIDVKAHLKI
ncbi:OmpH family outer membrane protein [Winogradskyella sp.]|jgi:outer membrane protein|uniref:OmpH family outer membrane protein n=1 Tax=Winogradskyella sp. TaxID=1883156 RepID=UPI0025E36D58|nr:OmpH family outer membrane protein [Winogradskyella sp.]MCT4628829.1 OmpH family outer membrane protein [Winogradskyella sp.]